ncbi:MAG: hypothetical protein A2804_03080 [Candidatus Pacebacteria bacterium RIFCSPHIGHO2_01_FULL_46_10]|nr:MAG: hypothetical protein A2804_03080 [Candidatus Pacebacteria bacterium RIFCSPHIGHO2_01_FULL_46_10]
MNTQRTYDLGRNLKDELQSFSQRIHDELIAFFAKKRKEAQKTDKTLEEIVDLLEELMLRGGKRTRPFLCWIGYTMMGGKDQKHILRACTALDMLHFYILSLDDMVDRDTVRHGGPTLEEEYKLVLKNLPEDQRPHYARSFSEIAGALLFSYAHECMRTSGLPAEYILESLGVMNKEMFQDTATGWKIHMMQNWESLETATEDRFVKGLNLVTAQYTFVGPLLIGTILAGKRKEYEKPLREYGMEVGTAFQIHDDVLGLFGNPEKTGKTVGNDVREGKKTLLIQRAYKTATEEDKAFLKNVLGSNLTEQDLKKVQDIVQKTGSLEYSKTRAAECVQKGVTALSSLPESHQKSLLIELAQFVITREK